MNKKIQSILCLFIIIPAILPVVGCKKGSVVESDLIVATLSQTEWELSFTNSSGTVEVILSGEGVTGILLDSIEMKGDNGAAPPLKALSAVLNGDQVTVGFARNRVIELLSNPANGSKHTVVITFLTGQSNQRQEINIQVSITETNESESPIDPAKLTLEVEPEEWSMNFPKSSGTVEVFIEGEGIDKLDLSSIQLKGDNPEAQPLSALSTARNNDKIHARFSKNLLLDLLLNPEKGSSHQITAVFSQTGSDVLLELTANITIEDDDDDDPIEPGDLELEIEPEEWSMNYPKSSGTVEVFLEGKGIEQIDLSSITMTGDNPAAEPLAAQSAALNGDKIHARFPKNQVLDLLLNPQEGSTHTITITFMSADGQEIQLTAVITIEDDDDDNGGGGNQLPSDLSLDLAPNHWNLNFSKGGGDVNAFIRGTGLDAIDLDSLEMQGDNPAAAPLIPSSVNLEGEHVKGKFAKNQVLELLLNPQSGSTHTVTVTFKDTKSGASYEVSTEVTVTGKAN